MISQLYLCAWSVQETVKTRRYEAETSALCFLDSWSLAFPRVLSEWFKKNFFLNVAWQSCRSVLFLEPFLDKSVDRTVFCWSGRAARRGNMSCWVDSSLSPSSFAPIFHGTLILSHFHSKLIPVYPVSTVTLLLEKYFANNILAVLNSPQPLSSYLRITLIVLNPTV